MHRGKDVNHAESLGLNCGVMWQFVCFKAIVCLSGVLSTRILIYLLWFFRVFTIKMTFVLIIKQGLFLTYKLLNMLPETIIPNFIYMEFPTESKSLRLCYLSLHDTCQ